MNKNTRGGKREGAGRPPSADPKIKIWFSVIKSKAEYAKAKIRLIVDKINKIS